MEQRTMYYKWILLFIFISMSAMESSSSSSGSETSVITVHKLPRLSLELFSSSLAVIHEGVELDEFSDVEVGFSRVHSKINVIDSDEYLDHIQQQSAMVRKFLDKHAKDGTTFRKCIEKAFSESESGSSDSNLHRPRSLSKTKFDELLAILGKAANQLEVKNDKQKKKNKRLKWATMIGTCTGAFCASLLTAIAVSVITYVSSTQ